MKKFGAGLAALLAIATVLVSFQPTPAASAEKAIATYSQGLIRVTIPYHAPRAGLGQWAVEILNPEDQVLARSVRPISLGEGKGSLFEDLKLAQAISVEDLVWHRVRYRFVYNGEKDALVEGTESISEILRMPVLHIVGQRSYLSGGAAAVRVVVADSKNDPIPGAGSVRIDLLTPDKQPRVLYTGRLNQRGTAEAQFRLPAGLVGAHQLRYMADTPIGSAEFTQAVRLEDKASILLTTEKPIYQPGQTIHVRALALDRARHEASAARPITFELEDSRGNKVFRKQTQTSKFGIASTEFALADEVNLGTYHLRARMEENTAEMALNVERYVLPKFKVAVDFAEAGKQAKHGYRPGDHVTGTVRANYFFGKPVDGAAITVKATGVDVTLAEMASVEGKTDGEGSYRFDLRLPHYLAGRPLSQGAARVLVEATVKDSAGHAETRGEPIVVSQSPLLLTAVPEGGTLIPGLSNQVFVLASYPDGKPAVADVKVRTPGNTEQSVTTDAGGVAVIRVTAGAETRSAEIVASDREGNRATTTVQFDMRPGAEQILLRTERAVYRSGDRIALKIFSTKSRGSAYVDVVKSGQTVMTRDVDIVNSQAELALIATPEMAGTLDFNAYVFGRDARPVADHRLVFVQPADELKIAAETDRPVYKPGEDASIRFRVTNGRGEGVQAALGLQVVDEAVFALAEKQPGFAKLFFYLEQEALKPRYEIHSLSMPDVVQPVAGAPADHRDRAARALFAATETVRGNRFETEVGRTVPRAKYAEYTQRYQTRFNADMQQLTKNLTEVYQKNSKAGELTRVAAEITLRDPWNMNFRVDRAGGAYYIVRSGGPDKQFNTADDLMRYVERRTGTTTGQPDSSVVSIDIKHDRGPFNGLAEIVGSVADVTGAGVAGASIKVREIFTGKERTTRADAAGNFGLAAIPAGTYQVEVESRGFNRGSGKFTLAVRDRVDLGVTLMMGAAVMMVEVADMQFGKDFRGGFGVGAGVGGRQQQQGGVVGGVINFRNEKFAAAPPPPPAVMKEMKPATLTLTSSISGSSAPRVRSYFPEALYINPEIITDPSGRATISIPLADSITTWRMAMMASTAHGALGSGTSSIKVFQDFFVDLDLPVTLTQGDRVSIPVAAYNYSGAKGDVSLDLQTDNWFSLVEDTAAKTIAVDSGRVGGTQFTIEAKRIGKFKLTLAARMAGGERRADIVVREIEVVPNGREQTQVHNGRLETAVHHEINFPATAIPDAGKIFVRLYPGPLSQVIEGMDAILRMPGGCFEQTSSSTYPNVLALDYMKRTKKLTPEVHAKAESYIANGYQRLLTFEVAGGGFSWFGNAPANKILTSYGLMEFHDMSKVYDVDPRLIERTQQWLAAQQQTDGSWKPDTSFINEGATNRYNSDALRITAYIAWSLKNTRYQGPAVDKAKRFIESHMNGANGKPDAYTLAVVANFAADYGNDQFTRQAMQLLLDASTAKDEQVWWTADQTGVYATGASAAVETTGLAAQALLKWGQGSGIATKALRYLASKKDASGTWGTTQATIMALRAILLSTEKGAADVRGTVEVTLNGKPVEKLVLTPDNADLLHQFVVNSSDLQAANTVDIRFTGTGGLAYQVVGRYFVPWSERPANEPLTIDLTYDRTSLAQDDIATATATVRNNLRKTANMVMIDLGIPPGFDLLTEDLEAFRAKSAGGKSGRLEKFSLTATQAILYFDSIGAGDTVTLLYRLRAKYPIRAKTFQSRVYEYYDPSVSSVAKPVQLEIRKK